MSKYFMPRDDELYHYGILGMKWGVRRYENEDGTLTSAGKKRYSKGHKKLSDKQKKIIRNVAIGAGATAAIAGLGYLGYKKLQPTYLKEAVETAKGYGKKVSPTMKKYYNSEILKISKNTNAVNPYKKSKMPFKTSKGDIAKPLALPTKSSYIKPSLKTSDIAGKKFKVKDGKHNISYNNKKILDMSYQKHPRAFYEYSRGNLNRDVRYKTRMQDYKKAKSSWNKLSKADKEWSNNMREGLINSGYDYDIYNVQKLGEKASTIGKKRLRIARKGIRHSDLYSNELYHYGVLGMKWGIRKFKGVGANTKHKKWKEMSKTQKQKRVSNILRGTALGLSAGIIGASAYAMYRKKLGNIANAKANANVPKYIRTLRNLKGEVSPEAYKHYKANINANRLSYALIAPALGASVASYYTDPNITAARKALKNRRKRRQK